MKQSLTYHEESLDSFGFVVSYKYSNRLTNYCPKQNFESYISTHTYSEHQRSYCTNTESYLFGNPQMIGL